jgi:hypothetical protein
MYTDQSPAQPLRVQVHDHCQYHVLGQLKSKFNPIWEQIVLAIRFGLGDSIENILISPKFHPLD